MQDARLIWAKGKLLSEYFQLLIQASPSAELDVPKAHSAAPIASSFINATASALRIHNHVQARAAAIGKLRDMLICEEVIAFGRVHRDGQQPTIEHLSPEICTAVEFDPERCVAASDHLRIDLIKIVPGPEVPQVSAVPAHAEPTETAPSKMGPKGDMTELRHWAIAAAYHQNTALFERVSLADRIAVYLAWIRKHHPDRADALRGLGEKSFEQSETKFKRSVGLIPLKPPISK